MTTDYETLFTELAETKAFDSAQSNFELSPIQEQIVNHKSKANLLVNAGAGSGKTRILIARVAKLIERGVNPKDIALLSFTKEAAEEMSRRLKLINKTPGFVGTIHALCFKALPKDSSIFLADDDLQLKVALEMFEDLPALRTAFEEPREMLSFLEKKRQELDFSDNSALILRSYLKHLSDYGAQDFTQMLEATHRLYVEGNSKPTFKYFLIDESQDLTPLQEECLKYFRKPNASFFFVGDPRQSIFSFRGKSSFENLFSGLLNGEVPEIYNLTDNRRSVGEIVNLANDILHIKDLPVQVPYRQSSAKSYPVKLITFPNESDEAKFIHYYHSQLAEDKTFAVLYRTNQLVDRVVQALEPLYPNCRLPSNLIIQTVHESKGCEYNTVVVAGMEAGVFPHRRASQTFEERKLLYVAITRAKDNLYFAATMTRGTDSQGSFALPSEFLPEIEAKLNIRKGQELNRESELPKRGQPA